MDIRFSGLTFESVRELIVELPDSFNIRFFYELNLNIIDKEGINGISQKGSYAKRINILIQYKKKFQ